MSGEAGENCSVSTERRDAGTTWQELDSEGQVPASKTTRSGELSCDKRLHWPGSVADDATDNTLLPALEAVEKESKLELLDQTPNWLRNRLLEQDW